jgi:hypothetical protein
MRTGHAAGILILGLALCFTGAAHAVRRGHDADHRRTVVLRAVAECLGMNSLALSSSGAGARQPLEGCAGCLGDVPAGYCLRAECEVVTSPGIDAKPMILERLEAAR